jgi:hypothetical protein
MAMRRISVLAVLVLLGAFALPGAQARAQSVAWTAPNGQYGLSYTGWVELPITAAEQSTVLKLAPHFLSPTAPHFCEARQQSMGAHPNPGEASPSMAARIDAAMATRLYTDNGDAAVTSVTHSDVGGTTVADITVIDAESARIRMQHRYRVFWVPGGQELLVVTMHCMGAVSLPAETFQEMDAILASLRIAG